ncbi:MAG: M56 family metallopeptidase [Pseudomonadota bacterium]
MSAFLFDTLIWTAALIALVLVLRRPVTKAFGAPVAYALWALPMLRLVLPPIELPAWLAPTKPVPEVVEGAGPATDLLIQITTDAAAASTDGTLVVQQSGWDAAFAALPLTELALALWLGGAVVFLYRRFSAYFRLRDELTVDARLVGTTKGPLGTIRLIETPGTTAPLAFGVLSPVIALPPGFMARVDRDARDLALEHELEHHRGHDLLINVLVQPLFALHWFNPLGRYGWLALRRDQEAACDARVIAAKPTEARALYANVIASFAAGPNVALAAPMACPVLGDKSIIQRLRNLKMTEQSSDTKGRKLASRLMLGAAVLALPLTASITYAESFAPEAPAAPNAPLAVPAPPAPPAPPAAMLNAGVFQDAPDAPDAPTPPEVVSTIVTVDPDTGETKTIVHNGDESSARVHTVKVKDKSVYVVRDIDEKTVDGSKTRYEKMKIVKRGEKLSDAEIEEIMVEVREGLSEANEAMIEAQVQLMELKNDEALQALSELEGQHRTVVKMSCSSDSDEIATTKRLESGGTEVLICQSRVMAQAMVGLEKAREAIANNPAIEGELREQILEELDEQIESWKEEAR